MGGSKGGPAPFGGGGVWQNGHCCPELDRSAPNDFGKQMPTFGLGEPAAPGKGRCLGVGHDQRVLRDAAQGGPVGMVVQPLGQHHRVEVLRHLRAGFGI